MKNIKSTLKLIILIIFTFTLIYCKSGANSGIDKQDESIDSSNSAILIPESSLIEIEQPKDNHFITKILKIYNKGRSQLIIKNTSSSCGCSNITVLESKIDPLDSGRIYLSINLEGLYDERNIVEYLLFSNAINSPTSIKIKILQSIIIDTLKK